MSKQSPSTPPSSDKLNPFQKPGLQLGIGLIVVVLITIASFAITQAVTRPQDARSWVPWGNEGDDSDNESEAAMSADEQAVQPVSDQLGLSPIARSEEEVIRQAYQLERQHQQLLRMIQEQFASEAPDLDTQSMRLLAATSGIETVATVYGIVVDGEDDPVPTLEPLASLSQACQIGQELTAAKIQRYPEMLPEVTNRQLQTILESSLAAAEQSDQDLFTTCE